MNLAQRGFELTNVIRLNNFVESSSQNSLLERTIILILPVIIILPPLSGTANLHNILLRLVIMLHLWGMISSNSSLSVAADLDYNVLWLDTLGLRERVGCFRVSDSFGHRNVLKFAWKIRASAFFDEFRAIIFIGHFFILNDVFI